MSELRSQFDKCSVFRLKVKIKRGKLFRMHCNLGRHDRLKVELDFKQVMSNSGGCFLCLSNFCAKVVGATSSEGFLV